MIIKIIRVKNKSDYIKKIKTKKSNDNIFT